MKEYCRLCKTYGTTMPNFPVRRGGTYGQNSGRMFVCEHYTGIMDGKLVVCISKDSGRNWTPVQIDSKNKIFRAIYDCLVRENGGRIPKVTFFHDGFTKVGYRPGERKVQSDYMRFRDTAYQLRKQNSDNCEYGHGGDAVMRHDPINHMKAKPESLQYKNNKIRRVTINKGEIVYDEITENGKLKKINYKTR